METMLNILQIKGDELERKALMEFIRGDEEIIDFNKIIPLDEITWDSTCAEWGSRWGAFGSELREDGTITFCSINVPPILAILALSTQFPAIELIYQFDDTVCIGRPKNTLIIRGGEVLYDRWAIEERERELAMNSTHNLLYLDGDVSEINALTEFIRGDEEIIDFNKIIPLDEITWDSTCAEWGSKGNACEAELVDYRILTFSTTESPATPAMVALSKKFPTIELTYKFSDADCIFTPYNVQIIKGGKIWYDKWAVEDAIKKAS